LNALLKAILARYHASSQLGLLEVQDRIEDSW